MIHQSLPKAVGGVYPSVGENGEFINRNRGWAFLRDLAIYLVGLMRRWKKTMLKFNPQLRYLFLKEAAPRDRGGY